MKRYHDLRGREFGWLSPVEYLRTVNRKAIWLCRCRCGTEVEVKSASLRDEKRKYCDRMKHIDEWNVAVINGDPDRLDLVMRPTWVSWNGMKSRCLYPNEAGWLNYGGRGIKVCERWQDFRLFLEDMGERPSKGHSIERIDVNGDYEPGNCKWATMDEQALNRRNTMWVEWRGERRKFMDVCRETGTDYHLVRGRIRSGWDLERAIATPRHIPVERPLPGRRGRKKSDQRIEVERLLSLGWSVDAVHRSTGASVSMVRKAKSPPNPDRPSSGPRGPKASPTRLECERLFRAGWSTDAVRRKTGASYGTVWNAQKDARRPVR